MKINRDEVNTMYDETVHSSKLKERLAFEVSINSSDMLSLLKNIIDEARTLSNLAQSLMGTLEVMENDQSR